MGKLLSLAWVVFFLTARGLLLFDTSVDKILILAGALFFWGQPDGDLETIEKYWLFHKKVVGAKSGQNDGRGI